MKKEKRIAIFEGKRIRREWVGINLKLSRRVGIIEK